MSIAPCSSGRAQPSKKRADVDPRPWPISDAFSITGESMRSCSAPPTIGTPSIRSSACQAGKHVYVEKPASHNISRGRRMVAAARKHRRVVQVGVSRAAAGTSPRPWNTSAAGALGRVALARAWESSKQRPIGYPKPTRPRPAWRRLRPLARSGAQAPVQPGAVSRHLALVLRLRDRRSRQRRRASA